MSTRDSATSATSATVEITSIDLKTNSVFSVFFLKITPANMVVFSAGTLTYLDIIIYF